jgi:hypothetical protein
MGKLVLEVDASLHYLGPSVDQPDRSALHMTYVYRQLRLLFSLRPPTSRPAVVGHAPILR